MLSLRRRSGLRPLQGAPRANGSGKPRVLYFIVAYPTFSETYMHEEIRALREKYEVLVITYRESKVPRREPFTYKVIPYQDPCLVYANIESVDVEFRSKTQKAFLREIGKVIEDFQPDILHGHYFGMALLLKQLSERYRIPFTIRTHSMDILSEPDEKLEAMCRAANSVWCDRILSFPANRQRLLARGLDEDKLVDCWPVLNFERFYRPEPRPATGRVMCAGPAIPKKAHNEFIDLAAMMRDSGLSFDLYADGPTIEKTRAHNEELGNPATITYADPDDMPGVYPNYDWLVYPSDQTIAKVGLPVALIEAQASGIGVCWQELPGRREEQLAFLGGGGFLFTSIDEVPAIISQPYPEEMRRAGFEAARRCDIQATKHLLSEGWDRKLQAKAAS
jgi:hypothetical protein